jgi:hypothetical protein
MKQLVTIPMVFFAISLFSQDLNYTPHDSLFFEHNTIAVTLDPSPGNIWQIGTPRKIWLDEAYSPPKAIVTDTINPYPPGNSSSFSFVIDSSQIFPYSGRLATYFSFIHRYETDTINDYGTIEASVDGGITWCNLSDYDCFSGNIPGPVWWEPDSSITSHLVYPHPERISGKSDGWIFSRFHFDYAIGKGQEPAFPFDSIIIRFTFTSNSSSAGNEGWLIDNIITGVCDIFVSAPVRLKDDAAVTVSPNPVTERSVIRWPDNKPGGSEITIYDETGRIVRKVKEGADDGVILSGSDFFPGIYFIKIQNGTERPLFGKFVVR